jgi:hypothetical protein
MSNGTISQAILAEIAQLPSLEFWPKTLTVKLQGLHISAYVILRILGRTSQHPRQLPQELADATMKVVQVMQLMQTGYSEKWGPEAGSFEEVTETVLPRR